MKLLEHLKYSAVITLLMSTTVLAGERTICQPQAVREGPDDHWAWRTKIIGDPNRYYDQCWYRGPRMKPRKELRWANPESMPSAMEPVGVRVWPTPTVSPSEDATFNERWGR
jgi:hypothetical protein